MTTNTLISDAGLFKRKDLYYARVLHSSSDGPLEIALHGIVSEEHARAALNALTRRPELRCDTDVDIARSE